jgi:hypothetical protein
MLTPESYQTAWLVYGGATLAGLAYLYIWIGPRMGRGSRLALLLVLAALALTPAHPGEEITSWAPAIFVIGFEMLTNGVEAGARPLRSLVAAEAIVFGLCLVAWLGRRLLGGRTTSGS